MRYVDSLNLSPDTECFILIEPGLGYIANVLRQKFINSKIIILHVNKNFPQIENCPAFYGTDKLQDFLEEQVPETESSRIKIIEWRPSLNFYKDEYVKLISHTADFIKRMEAGRRTRAVFGKRWIGNFFKNLENIKHCLLYKSMDLPVIITGSAPSLEEAIPIIKKNQESCFIIAVSSSVMALAHAGVKADIVITTDGGNWALRHIYKIFNQPFSSMLAANLCAALPSQCAGIPFLIMNDGSLWQSIILHELSLPSVIVPQRGTVSACAIDLALLLSSGNIYFAGMDLSIKEIRTHVRPYAFDQLLFENSCRFSPFYSQSFARSRQIRAGKSYDIYAAWFKKQFSVWPKRIFHLNSDTQIRSERKKTADFFKTVTATRNLPGSPAARGVTALLAALKKTEFAVSLKNELAPLLLQGKTDATERELETKIRELVKIKNYFPSTAGS